MSEGVVVCDTTVLLYLGRIRHAWLLPKLFSTVVLPSPVVSELDAGRQIRSDTIDPQALDWVEIIRVEAAALSALPPCDLGQARGV
jgi:predicted nucleic acid-binding protein